MDAATRDPFRKVAAVRGAVNEILTSKRETPFQPSETSIVSI